MIFKLDTIDWQAIASMLTFIAVCIALWTVGIERRQRKRRTQHYRRRFRNHLNILIMQMNEVLNPIKRSKKTDDQKDRILVKLTPEMKENIDILKQMFNEAFNIQNVRIYEIICHIYVRLLMLSEKEEMKYFHMNISRDELHESVTKWTSVSIPWWLKQLWKIRYKLFKKTVVLGGWRLEDEFKKKKNE